MNSREIEKLLMKFYEGGTTLAEEEKIREFFLSEEIPPHLSSDAELFLGMAGASGEKIGDPSFEEEFLSRIDTTPVVHIDSRRNRVLYISGIAAGILLLTGLFFTFRNDIYQRSANEELQDPVAAYAQTRKALMLVSSNLNTGLDKILYLSEFSKGMENVQKISAFYKHQTIIINPDDKPRSKKQ
jgi:hypothetical protein